MAKHVTNSLHPNIYPLARLVARAGEDDLSFPESLYHLLQRRTANNIDHIVSFLEHGRAFLIYDEERFRNEVLPVWFPDLEWEDFLEQLNRFGFRQLRNPGPDQGAYYHELFLRSQSGFVQQMQPLPNGVTVNYNRPDPDFYRMPWLDRVERTHPLEHFLHFAAPQTPMAPMFASLPGLVSEAVAHLNHTPLRPEAANDGLPVSSTQTTPSLVSSSTSEAAPSSRRSEQEEEEARNNNNDDVDTAEEEEDQDDEIDFYDDIIERLA